MRALNVEGVRGCPQLWIGLCPHVDVREFPGRSARSQAPTIGSEIHNRGQPPSRDLWRAESELAALVLSVFSGGPPAQAPRATSGAPGGAS